MDTPSPELRRTHLSRLTTPKSVACRKIANSPAFLANRVITEFSELSMSPLQLLDSPVQAALMTPSTSSGESSGRKSPRYLKQTSTPSDEMMPDTPSNNNKAFIIASNAFVGIKAKRRLIEEESNNSKGSQESSTRKREHSAPGNAAKKQKTTPKAATFTLSSFSRNKKFSGKINSGVSHRIRRPEKKLKPSSLSISLTDLKKAKAESLTKHPLDPLTKILPQPANDVKTKQSEDNCSSDIENTPPVCKNVEQLENVTSPKPQSMTPKALNNSSFKEKKVIGISPKVLTRNWNQRYRKDTRERKFFKSRGTEENTPNRVVTVSVNDNIKLQIHDKPVAQPRRSPRKSPVKNKIQTPVQVSDNRIEILNQDWDEDTADSMDISSNIQDILNGLNEEEPADKAPEESTVLSQKENPESNKFFPLFCKNTNKPPQPQPTEERSDKKVNVKSQWLRALNEGENQTILDAGQKTFGAVQCPECMMVYHVKDPEDELLHASTHNSVYETLKFAGWKKEKVVRRFNSEGYIVVVNHTDSAHCWKKVETILAKVVDHELGFSHIGIRNPDSTKVYIYITEKKIVGVVVAESLKQGYRMIPSSITPGKCCSTDPVPALCGISRIWTLASFRRRGIASRLIDAMRSDFIYGKIVTTDEIAFSDPTENGLNFAQTYTKRQDFLVYNM